MAGEKPVPRATRVSIACIPCRSRHTKCDATRPYCRRCSSEGKKCYYEKSRRGGLDRATLAARRNQRNRDAESSSSSGLMGSLESHDVSLEGDPAHAGRPWQPPASDNGSTGSDSRSIAALIDPLFGIPDSIHSIHPSGWTENDPLIGLYYEHFHRFHPCVLPQRYLRRYLQDPSRRACLEPLVSVLRFIGSLYGLSAESSKLEEQARKCNNSLQCPAGRLDRAFLVQSRLLLSIALYWSTDMEESRWALDRAIRDGFDLGMHRRPFAAENSAGDPVLEESWRRTWWQVVIVDAYFAAIKRKPIFVAQDEEPTLDMPCEEEVYESGSIPVPKTVEEFDNREFAPDDHVYSSFAYLIGSIRCASSAVAIAWQGSTQNMSEEAVEAVGVMIEGWFLLLPESKRQVMGKDGIIDELMFQAHMGANACVLAVHRPYSNLLYNPMEIISSCATGSPKPLPIGNLVNVHTTRCLKSVEAQLRLMALPARPFCHTPFVICMMTAGTIPLLSACKFLFTEKRLGIARHQIRMSIGCLKAMAGIWPQAAVHVRQLQTIAQEVLGLPSREAAVAPDAGASGNSSNGTPSGSSTAVEPFETQLDGPFPLDSLDDGFQVGWDNLQHDLACYDFSAIG